MISSATLLGSSSGRNAGDAALISGIMDSIDEVAGDRLLYEIPTIRPNFIYNNYKNRVRAISMLPWSASVKMLGLPTFNSIMRTDISMIFDAILFDRSLFNPLFNHMSTLALLLPIAKRRGKRLAFFNVGAGPVDTPRGREMLRELSEAMDFITVRDQGSYDVLKDIGVKNPRMLITADAALNVQASPTARVDEIMGFLGFNPEEQILGLNVSMYLDSWARPKLEGPKRKGMPREDFIKVYAEAVNQVIGQLGCAVLFICTQHDDVDLSLKIKERLTGPKKIALISNVNHSHYEIKGVLGRMSLLFAMRLHAVILASSELAPVISLPHQPKVKHFMRTLELEEYCLGFENFEPVTLANHILKGWGEREKIKEKLNTHIPVLSREAYKAAELVLALGQGKNIDTVIAEMNSRANPQALKIVGGANG